MTKTEIIRTIADQAQHESVSGIFTTAIVNACVAELNKPFDWEQTANRIDKLSRLKRAISDCDMLIQRYMSYDDDTTWNEPITVEKSKREIYLNELIKEIEKL